MSTNTHRATVVSFDAVSGEIVASVPKMFGTKLMTLKPQVIRPGDIARIAAVHAGDHVWVVDYDDSAPPLWTPRVFDEAFDLIVPPPSPDEFQHVHTQIAAAFVWTIVHNLGGYPNITTVDYSGNVIEGDYVYDNANQITVTFTVLIDGKAYLS